MSTASYIFQEPMVFFWLPWKKRREVGSSISKTSGELIGAGQCLRTKLLCGWIQLTACNFALVTIMLA
jgi:hypothetical protein